MNPRTAPVLVVLALLALPACLDPIVGGECKPGFSPCHGACLPAGVCQTLDASSEASTGIDGAGGTELDAGDLDADEIDADGVADGGGMADEAGATSEAGAMDASPVDGNDRETGRDDGDTARRRDDGGTGRDVRDGDDVADVPLRDDRPRDGTPILAVDDAGLDGNTDAEGLDGDCLACLDGERATDADPVDGGAGNDPGGSDDAAGNGSSGDAPDAGAVNDGDAAIDDAGNGDLGQDDSGPDGPLVCTEPLLICNDTCVDPSLDPENCGDCNNICATGVCLSGTCLLCGPDESVCEQRCLNLSTDPDNCGACGVPCPSGLCSNGRCEAAGTGRAIVIGHDYTKNRSAMNRILGNAVFLWPVNPVRLLAYPGDADPVAIGGANSAIQQVATATGRQPSVTIAGSSAEVPAALAATDVFLIYGQTQASDSTLARLGQDWKAAMTTFVQTGGTVIVLDASYAANRGTVQILSQAGLFDIVRGNSITGDVCSVIARGDALATGLLRTYRCEVNSANFTINDTATTITPVVADGVATVVVHKIF
jgi:hypothetical protein